MMESILKKIGVLFAIITVLVFASIIVAFILSFATGESLTNGNVALIPVHGVIINGESGLFSDSLDTTYVRKSIETAAAEDNIKAIVLEINSPGGAPVASDEIATALRLANKPTVAWIRDVGASGAYWIATSTDHIIANRMSITGSVGVTASYIDFSGTLQRYNASYEQLEGGIYKEVGTPFKSLNDDERALLQKKIDMLHTFFLDEVQERRNLTDAQRERISTGEFFLGAEAIDLGLIDEVGSYPELDAYLENKIGEAPVYKRYEKSHGFLGNLYGLKQDFFPRSKLEIRT